MPYKKQSPFSSFRDPLKIKQNFNPVEFKMPDLSPIYNKKADGGVSVTEESDKSVYENQGKNAELEQFIDKKRGEEKSGGIINDAKQRKIDVKAEEKEFRTNLKDARQAKNLRAKYQTAEEKKQATDVFKEIQSERNFRVESKLNRENKEDRRNALMGSKAPQPPPVKKEKPLSQNMLNQAHNVRLMDEKGKSGTFSNVARISSQKNIPMDRIKASGRGATFPGANSPGRAPFNDSSVLKDNDEPPMDASEKRKMQMIKNPLGRGLQMNKNMNQVKTRGSAFPMVSPQAQQQPMPQQQMPQQQMPAPQAQTPAIQPEQPTHQMPDGTMMPGESHGEQAVPNRAGNSPDANTLTNNVLPNQSMSKVPASNIKRDLSLNNKAMSQGSLYQDPQASGMNSTNDSSFNTPQAETFPNQSAVSMYDKNRSSFSKAIDFGSLKKGALREELNIPEGEKIPLSKLEIKPGDNETTRKRKTLAKSMRGFNKG